MFRERFVHFLWLYVHVSRVVLCIFSEVISSCLEEHVFYGNLCMFWGDNLCMVSVVICVCSEWQSRRRFIYVLGVNSCSFDNVGGIIIIFAFSGIR